MPLVQSFAVSENQFGTTFYLDDTTGDYDAVDNPGGYGTPNPARATLALILLVRYKALSGDVAYTVSTYDPEVVTQFTVPNISVDGRYQFKVYTVNIKTGSESPSTNDFVYNASTDQLERWNGSAWVIAQQTELETYDAAHTTVEHAHLADVFTAFNRINKLLSGSCKCPRSDLRQYMMETDVVINGSLANFTEGNYSVFQDIIEKYQSRVDKLKTLE